MSMLGAGLMNIFIAIGLTGLGRHRPADAGPGDGAQGKGVRRRRPRASAPASPACSAATSCPTRSRPIVVAVTFGIPEAIFTEAALSFIGVGINPPTPSWGQMVGEGQQFIRSYWHLCVFPAIAIAVTMLVVHLLRRRRARRARSQDEVGIPTQEATMKRPPISDAQMDLLAERLGAVGVGRRDFLKVAGRSRRAGRRRLQRPAGVGGAQARRRREARQGAAPPDRRRRLVAERPVQPRLQQGPLLHRRAPRSGPAS